jgi:hypothetical protein
MVRIVGLAALLAVIALSAGSAGAYDWKIWVSGAGNPPPGGFVPDFTTTLPSLAADWIRLNVSQVDAAHGDSGNGYSTLYEDTVTVLLDDGVYFDYLIENVNFTTPSHSSFNMVENLTLKSVSGDPTQCIIDHGNPPGGEYVTIPGDVLLIRSCHNFLVEGITLRGSELFSVVHPGVGDRYPRKIFLAGYVEIDPTGTMYSAYLADGTPMALDVPIGTKVEGDIAEVPQPVGFGLGQTKPGGTNPSGYLIVNVGAVGQNMPGDRAWFRTIPWRNVTNGWIGPLQDGIVTGDVLLDIHIGDFGIASDEAGYAINSYGGSGGSGSGSGYYVAPNYLKGTYRNLILEHSKTARIVQASNPAGGPNNDERGHVTVDNCIIRDMQGPDGLYIGTSDVDFVDSIIDGVGGRTIYSAWTGTVGTERYANGIPVFGSAGSPYQSYGPYDVNVLNSTIRDVRELDWGYDNYGLGIHYWDSANEGSGWKQGAVNLTVDGCKFERNYRDIWVCDPADDNQTSIVLRNSEFLDHMAIGLWLYGNGNPVTVENCTVANANHIADPWYDEADTSDNGDGIRADGNRRTDHDGIPSAPRHVRNCYVEGSRLGIVQGNTGVADFTDVTIVEGGIWGDFWTGGFWSDCGVAGYNKIDDMWIIDARGQGIASAWWAYGGWHDVNNLLVVGAYHNGLWADCDITKGQTVFILNKCTFAHCLPTQWGDGIAVDEDYVLMENCISAFNPEWGVVIWEPQGACDAYYSDAYGNGFNPVGGPYGDWYTVQQPNMGPPVNLVEGNISADPLFAGRDPTPPAGQSMLFPCWDLSPGSPCIDSGDPDPLYNDPDGSRADMGAIPYGTHELTLGTNLADGQNWLGIPLCPYDPQKDAKELLSLDPGLRVTITRYDNALRSWLGYGDFTYVRPGDMLWVYIAPGGKRATYPVSVTGVKVRTSVEIDIMSAGHLFFSCPYEYPYNLHDLEVTKYTNVTGRWTVLEKRTMLEDFYSPTTWIDWHLAFYHDFGVDFFNLPDANDNWLVPWQGYYMSIRATALPPDGSEKLGLKFFRDPKGAITK